MDIFRPDSFLDSLFAYLRPKGEGKGLDDGRPAMMAHLLGLQPTEVMLMEPNDFAAVFSAHLIGECSKQTLEEIEEFEFAEEAELDMLLIQLAASGCVVLAVDRMRTDVKEFVAAISSSPEGIAYLARVAIHLSHGRRSKRAAIHLFTPKES